MKKRQTGSSGLGRVASLVGLILIGTVLLAGAANDAASEGPMPDARNHWSQILPIQIDYETIETLNTGHYTYDAQRELIYAEQQGANSSYEDAVIPISLSGEIGTPIYVFRYPGVMTISDDGQYLYVGTWLPAKIVKIDLDAWQIVDTWFLTDPASEENYDLTLYELYTVPGDPNAVVVSREGLEPGVLYETAVYDASGMRPNTVQSFHPMQLAGACTPDIIHGVAESRLHVMRVDDGGLTALETHDNLLGGNITYADGLLFDEDGYVVATDPYQRLGRFNTSGPVVPDVAAGYVYYLHEETIHDTPQLEVFDLTTFRKLAETDLEIDPNIPWSTKGAFFAVSEGRYAFSASPGLKLMRFAILDHAVGIPVAADSFCGDFADDFSSRLYGWPEYDDGQSLVEYHDGEYRFLARTSHVVSIVAPICFRPQYEVSVDVRLAGGGPGLFGITFQTFRSDWFSGPGAIDPLSQGWSLYGINYAENAGGLTYLVDPEFNPSIRPGDAVNRVRLIHYGHIVALYVNDVEIAYTGQIPRPDPAAVVGLVVWPREGTRTTDVRFDNFTYKPLPPQPVE